MSLRFAYNTNGLQSHRLEDALELLAEVGYAGVALTLDHMHLDPLRASPAEVGAVKKMLRRLGLACAIETGARFVLDPRRKHYPGLCHPDPLERMRRVDMLKRCVEVAADLEAEVVNLAAGPRIAGQDPDTAERFLVEGLREVFVRAEELDVLLALEPEPGHSVDTLRGYQAVRSHLPQISLTIDVGHVSVEEPEGTAAAAIKYHSGWLSLIHLEDAPAGRHEHLPFGEGDLKLVDILLALEEIGFGGLCAVELSRHSHSAHELTRRSLDILTSTEAEASEMRRRRSATTQKMDRQEEE